MNIEDPCGHERGYQRIVTIYIKYLMSGVNFRNKDFLGSDTIRGYATSINALFKLQDMKPPVDVANPNNISGILINNLVKEEDIARQRSPLDSDIFTKLLQKSNISWSQDSEHSTLFNLVAIGCYIGPCMSEYAQTSDKNVDYHVYPSGKQVIKVFIASDFTFYDEKSQSIADLSDVLFATVERVHITWHIQKNRQNNQKITLSCDKANKAICPVLAALCLVLRACRLLQLDSMPVACYGKKDSLAYITGTRIAVLFRAAARAVCPTITKEEEQRYSAHLLRVWACVLLDEVGKTPDLIKKHLCWMGNSFWMYLCNMRIIQDQHCKALQALSKEVMDLIDALTAKIICLSSMSNGTGDADDMGVYHEDMD
jgi:hypothetical protein